MMLTNPFRGTVVGEENKLGVSSAENFLGQLPYERNGTRIGRDGLGDRHGRGLEAALPVLNVVLLERVALLLDVVANDACRLLLEHSQPLNAHVVLDVFKRFP